MASQYCVLYFLVQSLWSVQLLQLQSGGALSRYDAINGRHLQRILPLATVHDRPRPVYSTARLKRGSEANQTVVVRNSQGVCAIFTVFGV